MAPGWDLSKSIVLWLVSLLACGGVAVAAPSISLDERFADAKSDPAAIVPLILEASRAISERPTDEGHAIAARLQPFVKRAFFSGEVIPGMERLGILRHKVKAGQLPSGIASRYRIAPEMLLALNPQLDPRRVGAGKRLKVVDLSNGSLRIVVDRKHFRLALWISVRVPGETFDEPHDPAEMATTQHVLMGYFPIACGSHASPTPTGSTRIAVRVRHPSWRDPKTKKVYGPNDKKNVLGGYWLGLDKKLLGQGGVGIHGYSGSPPKNWIGKPVSHGCIRLLAEDIDRVFNVARVGTRVRIY